ncbi:hypothetical protein LT493_19690 [Streptomyces tricolor]|nr:hypothetical protein [Streptomyces tricolor]
MRGALDGMLAAARLGGDMIEPMLDAVRAEATLGEICGVLREEWGCTPSPPVSRRSRGGREAYGCAGQAAAAPG